MPALFQERTIEAAIKVPNIVMMPVFERIQHHWVGLMPQRLVEIVPKGKFHKSHTITLYRMKQRVGLPDDVNVARFERIALDAAQLRSCQTGLRGRLRRYRRWVKLPVAIH